jgi:NADH:ubiquinone oxidoreductase subunit 5 (subunit L)/multisubunit Na+/H+ antiporter MnhA subunit
MLGDYSLLAFAAILAPLILALLSYLIAKMPRIGDCSSKVLCVFTSYAALLMILVLAYVVVESGPIAGSFAIASLPIGELALAIYVDELALIPTIFFALFASLAITYSFKYLSPENRYRSVPATFNRGFSFMLLFLGSLIGVCFSSNMLFFLFFWEITTLCSFLLVRFLSDELKFRKAAFKTFVMLHIGTFSLLLGAIAIYPLVGTWEIHNWSQSILGQSIMPLVLVLFLIGILPKAVQFPLHTWFPDATVTATPVAVYIHAGFLMVLYSLLRFFGQVFAPYINAGPVLALPFSLFFGNISIWAFIICLIGASTSIIAALFALLENESKRVLAYVSISVVGSTVMILGLATPLGIAAGILSMIYHFLFITLIFLAIGGVIFQVGKTSLDSMGGLSRFMPITAVLGTLGAVSMVGFPFLGYFAAQELGIHAALELNATLFVIVLLVSSILKTAAILRLTNAVFFGKAVEYTKKIRESPAIMLFPMIFIAACLLVLGAFPILLLNHLAVPAINCLQPEPVLGLALPSDVITGSGLWNPFWATIPFVLYLGLITGGIYFLSKRRGSSRAENLEDEALKPFLCGEDAHLLEGARANHFYHTLIQVLKIDAVCRTLDVDRVYNVLFESFFAFCRKMRKRFT